MTLRIRLLGRPALERERASVRLEGRKTWALLAYLLLSPRPPTRREIAERLWSEAQDPLAAARWTLSQVRKALAPDAEVVERDGRLEVAGSFAVDACEILDGKWDATAIDEAIGGELLEGIEPDDLPGLSTWLSAQRARVGSASVQALRSCAATLVHRDPVMALGIAERALAMEPFDDALHELVVECHAARGDLAQARGYIEEVARRYRAELGVAAPQGLERALERPRADGPLIRLDLEARALLDTARARADAGAWDDARDMTMRAVRAAAARGDRALEARGIVAFLNIRTCQVGRGRAEWDPLLQRAFILATEIGDATLLCEVEIERGRLAGIEGRYGTAEASLRRALAAAQELGDALLVASARRLLGTSETERCDHLAAEADLRAAAEHPARRDAALAYLARLLVRMRRWDEGEEVAEASAARLSGDGIVWAPLAIIQSGEVRLARGDITRASERLARALTIARETGDADWTALALRGLAHVDRRDGRPQRAIATLREALDVATTHPGCRRWCEALILTDLVEWEDAADASHLDRGLALALSGPMPDLAERLAQYRGSHTPVHTVAS